MEIRFNTFSNLNFYSLIFHRDSLSVRHTQLEPDSNLSVAPVAPKGGTVPPPGPHRFIAAEFVTRSALWSVEPNMVKEFSPSLLTAPVVCMPLYAVTFGS